MKVKINKTYLQNIFTIGLLLILAALFRYYNLNWDLGNFFHPDERNIANAVSQIKFFSQLNPNFFAYGGFFIYLIRAVGELIVFITGNTNWVYNWGLIDVIGRTIAATFSTFTIIPLYFLTKKVFDKSTAILACIFFALCVGSIQIAHFGITENLITFFAVAVSYGAVLIYKTKKIKYFLLTGFLLGMAVATKTTAISFYIAPLFAWLFVLQETFKNKGELIKLVLYFLGLVITSIIFFLLLSPYTILAFQKFSESMRYESGVALGTLPVPYTLQFSGTSAYLFQIKNFFWQLGLITVLSILGFFVLLYKTLGNKNKTFFILLSFPLSYFLYVGSWHTKFIRFMLPIIPFLLIFAAFVCFQIYYENKKVGKIIITISLIASLFWACTYMSVYKTTQTRVQASNWIYKDIPGGAKLLSEQWDDGLPIPIADHAPSSYNIEQLAMYDQDNNQKLLYLGDKLSNADYIILNSRRLYGTLIHLNKQYPLTSKYYKLLFAGKLGYKNVAEFSSYPTFLGITINDDSSEETFQVYDHPKAIVFKNIEHLSASQIEQVIKQ